MKTPPGVAVGAGGGGTRLPPCICNPPTWLSPFRSPFLMTNIADKSAICGAKGGYRRARSNKPTLKKKKSPKVWRCQKSSMEFLFAICAHLGKRQNPKILSKKPASKQAQKSETGWVVQVIPTDCSPEQWHGRRGHDLHKAEVRLPKNQIIYSRYFFRNIFSQKNVSTQILAKN